MIRRAIVASAVAFTFAVPGDMLACGEKFFVPSRGARFNKRPVDRASATILLYARPGTALSETLATQSVEARLRAAGYRPTLVTSEAGLDGAAREPGWAVVVVDLADAPGVARRMAGSAMPTVVPVVYDVPKTTLDEARHQYRQVLRSPKKDKAFLEAVDAAIAARARTRTRSVTSAG
jgi:hypothetical protein